MKISLYSSIIVISTWVSCTSHDQHDASEQASAGPTTYAVMLTEGQEKLANITTEKVSVHTLGDTRIINARLVSNERLRENISSRIAGRIEQLYIKETGRRVVRGQPLYRLYSETLLTLQQEYRLSHMRYQASKLATDAALLAAARQKLLLYGLTSDEVDALGNTEAASSTALFRAPVSGVISAISVAEGQYISEGERLYELEDLSTLWVEAELYPGESEHVMPGQAIQVVMAGDDAQPMTSTISFLSPVLRAGTQVVTMRAALPNEQGRYQPGMAAQVIVRHGATTGPAVPADAVIRNKQGAHVYVQTAPHTFEPRPVVLGAEERGLINISSGLQPDDVVVVTGAYLLYSEMILRYGHAVAAAGHHPENFQNMEAIH